MKKDFKKVEVKSIEDLRLWLTENQSQKESVWLVSYKKSNPDFYIEYSAIVDELLCFGWIDSLPRKLDENRKMLLISPRKEKSAWSKINRDKVKRLIKEGRITKHGMAIIEKAKKNGSWQTLKSVDKNQVPQDLSDQFKNFKNSKENFDNFPPSSRRAILEWITQAKTEQTRKKRILETAKLAEKNNRANHFSQKRAPK